MSAGRYLGTALGGALQREFTAAEVAEVWDATDEDLRERDDDGVITLWARAVTYPGRLPLPIHLHPLDGEQAA